MGSRRDVRLKARRARRGSISREATGSTDGSPTLPDRARAADFSQYGRDAVSQPPMREHTLHRRQERVRVYESPCASSCLRFLCVDA